jgi:N-acyl-L-homoserine lactone synthetase
MAGPTPRQVVEEMLLSQLASLLMPHRPFAGYDEFARFVCPKCRAEDHNGGTATIDNEILWHCLTCGSQTRYTIEAEVLSDPGLLMQAMSMMAGSQSR